MKSFKIVSEKFAPIVGKVGPLAIQTSGTCDIFSRNAITLHSQVIVSHDDSDLQTLNRNFSGNCGWDGSRTIFLHNTDLRYVEPVEMFFEEHKVGKLKHLFLYDPYFIAINEDSTLVFGSYGVEDFIIEPQVQVICGLGDFERMMPVFHRRRGMILVNGRVWTPGRMRSERHSDYVDYLCDNENIYADKRKELVKEISKMTIKLWSKELSDKEITDLIVEMDDATKEWAKKNIGIWETSDPIKLGAPFANWAYPSISGFNEDKLGLIEIIRNVESRSTMNVTLEDGYIVLAPKDGTTIRDTRIDETIGFDVCPGLEFPAANTFFSRDYNQRGKYFFEY